MTTHELTRLAHTLLRQEVTEGKAFCLRQRFCIHPREFISLFLYLCNTEHISVQFLVNNPYLQRQKLRHLGFSPDFQYKSVGLVDTQHLPYLQNSLLTGSPLKSMKHFFKDTLCGCFALSNLPAAFLLACFFLFYCFMICFNYTI